MSAREPGRRDALRLLALGTLATGCARPEARDGTLRLYLARHGQTDWNAERRLQGSSDTELNAKGLEQARRLAARMRPVPLEAVYASTLRRSRETARIAAEGRGIEVEPLAGLAERHVGRFEGAWLDGRDPAIVEEYRRRSTDPADDLDGGETPEQHFARTREAVASIAARHPAGAVLVVGHGGTNAMIVRALLGLPAGAEERFRQANDELYLIEIASGRAPVLWKDVTAELGET